MSTYVSVATNVRQPVTNSSSTRLQRSGWTLPADIKMDTVEFLEGKSFYVIKYKLPEECIYKRKASKKTFSEFSNMCIPKADQSTSKDIKFPSLTVGSTA